MSRPFKTPVYVIKSDKSALPPFAYCRRIPNKERKDSEKADYKVSLRSSTLVKLLDY